MVVESFMLKNGNPIHTYLVWYSGNAKKTKRCPDGCLLVMRSENF